MIKGIHHMTLVVRDLAAARRYYGATVGAGSIAEANAEMLVQADRALGGTGFDHCMLAGRNGYLQLIAPRWSGGPPASVGNPINRAGIRHFCIQNHSCAMLADAVATEGGTLIAAPLDLGTGNQYAYARDIEGNIMEIEGLPYAPVGEPTWLAHVALVTRDIDRAIAFYAGLLGTGLKNRGRFGPGVQFDRMGGLIDAQIEGAWLPAGNLQLEFWQFHAPPSPHEPGPRAPFDPGFSRLCLESDDLEADTARLVAHGGTLLTRSLESEGMRSILGSDPEGNCIEIVELGTAGAALSIAALAAPDVCSRVEDYG
jgi:catechol 2,3-dioxygenase-like lactoylglutathione lyase family enzyme